MDYKEKYEMALERARVWKEKSGMPADKQGILDDIFPELAGSEDEKVRKEIVEYLKKNLRLEWATWLEKQGEPQDKGEISDGYHTFNELYYYRMLYNAAFFNMLPKEWVYKSKRHNDGEECFGGGWFIVMANLPTGQISNHYELKDWDLFQIPEKEVADKWDGHTPQKAADRLHKYLLEKQGEQKPTIEMKSAEESLGIDSDTYNEIVDECIYGEQKSWSEEDEKMINDAISFISHSAFKTIGKGKKNTISWLKSLKDRVQPKQEWSEDDDDKFFFLKARLKDYEDYTIYDEELSEWQKNNVRETTKEFLEWLDSIKERMGG